MAGVVGAYLSSDRAKWYTLDRSPFNHRVNTEKVIYTHIHTYGQFGITN